MREFPLKKRGARGFFLLLLLMFLSLPPAAAEIELSGYYKNLLINSKTLPLFGSSESYLLDINRLRLKLTGDVSNSIAFNLQYDNEVLLGNYLKTREFTSLLKNRPSDSYFDLDKKYSDNNLYGKHSVYRAYVDLTLREIDLRLGRQRIAWGTTMLWNPMDILNPFNPVQLERTERQGIDAVLMDWDYSALSRVSLVYAKQQNGESRAIRWRSNQKGFDLSLTAGSFRGDNVAGFDFAGQVMEIGVRGEITQTDSENEGRLIKAVIGADYSFANSLSLNIEFYYNEQGFSDPTAYEFNRLLSGELQSLARRYLGGYLGYDITPLLQWSNYLILNLDDNSVFFAPGLVYSLMDNIETRVGAQIFYGNTGTEYGTLNDRYIVQLQWYFQ